MPSPAAAAHAARQHGLQHEVLDSAQVAQRFSAYCLPPDMQTMYEPEAGILAPERCIEAHLRLAQEKGAQLACSVRVQGWQALPREAGGSGSGGASGNSTGICSSGGIEDGGQSGLVRVDTDAGSFTAKKLVLAAGGWMPQLVPELQVCGEFGVSLHQCDCQMLCSAVLNMLPMLPVQPARFLPALRSFILHPPTRPAAPPDGRAPGGWLV